MATQQFLQQFQQHLELKHTTQLTTVTRSTSLDLRSWARQLNCRTMDQYNCSSRQSTTTRS
eukprot:499563-Amphidinium_carterae.1